MEQQGLSAANLAFVEEVYERWRDDPAAVSAAWRHWFEAVEAGGDDVPPMPTGSAPAPARSAPRTTDQVRAIASAEPASSLTDAALAERLPFLKGVSLFRDLPASGLEMVASVAREVRYRPGEFLLRTGQTGDGLYVIVEGNVRIERGSEVIAVLSPGQVVGELAFMDKQPRSADAVAHTNCRLLKIHADALDELLDRHTELARGLFHVVTRRLREANARQERVDQLVRAYRVRGHAIAELDPLGRRPKTHPELELEYYGLTDTDLDVPFSSRTLHGAQMLTLRRIIQRLHNTYCRHIGAQFMHIDDLGVQRWLQQRMEDTENVRTMPREEQVRILTRLTEAELFESFIHKKYLGAKRFSLEGGESLIPLLDMAIEEAAASGVRHMVIGMAHRGRLNVLSNIMGKTPAEIFLEFEDLDGEAKIGKGDVKYHMGFSSMRRTAVGADVSLSLTFNPSHLEFVTPVVQGQVRAGQDRLGDSTRNRVLGLVIHGDASFAGQGVVQESLNLSGLPGYRTGGTLHIIVNNQVGFTTDPRDSRSSLYCTDVAKMLEIPIFHVNGENPQAVAQVIKLALEFRRRFGRDVVIDMYCYRRHGHNEGDEPRFTQPLMYQWVDRQPTVREGYIENLVALGDMSPSDAERIAEDCRARLEADLARVRSRHAGKGPTTPMASIWHGYQGGSDLDAAEVSTAVSKERLNHLIERLSVVREGFSVHPKLLRLLNQRREMVAGDKPLDWGAAEALAFATLLVDGTRLRISGQDSQRGTFSHRHSVLHDMTDGETWTPLQHLEPGQGPFEVWNSPLSEAAVLGFDYGYSLVWPDGLTIWEAQFGDFANGAQVIIDQFIGSGEDKWERLSGLVLMLPHGMEGQGPEHSSARLERFLTLASEDNIFVCNLTTPAQLFHGLRRHMRRRIRKPMVIMTPKWLLRLPEATSHIDELAEGRFHKVLPDEGERDPTTVSRVLLCSGKVYYELVAERAKRGAEDIAIVRVEQLYPLPQAELRDVLSPYADGTEVRWVQDEPVNMGAWVFLRFRLGGRLFGRMPFRRASRPESSSPATGSAASHRLEQARLMDAAFADEAQSGPGRM